MSPDFGADLAAGGPELPQRRDVNSARVTWAVGMRIIH